MIEIKLEILDTHSPISIDGDFVYEPKGWTMFHYWYSDDFATVTMDGDGYLLFAPQDIPTGQFGDSPSDLIRVELKNHKTGETKLIQYEFYFADGATQVLGSEVAGTEKKDRLAGSDGNDKITGEGGNDRLYGGLGNDELLGRKGADTFVLRDGQGHDTLDFNLKEGDRVIYDGHRLTAAEAQDVLYRDNGGLYHFDDGYAAYAALELGL